MLKELREILRDRRTIITLVVMPLLIYPLLAIVFQRFLVTSLSVNQDTNYVIGVDSLIGRQILENQLRVGDAALAARRKNEDADTSSQRKRDPANQGGTPHVGLAPIQEVAEPTIMLEAFPDANLERFVADSFLHLAIVHHRESTGDSETGLETPLVWELIYRAGSPPSEAALNFVESRLQASNEVGLNEQLKQLKVAAALPASLERHPINFNGAPVFSLAALIPLILVLDDRDRGRLSGDRFDGRRARARHARNADRSTGATARVAVRKICCSAYRGADYRSG